MITKRSILDCDYVHTMPAKFENDEKGDGSKFLASMHTILAQYENGMKLHGERLVELFARILC